MFEIYIYVLTLNNFWAAEGVCYLKKQFILKQSGLLSKIDKWSNSLFLKCIYM